MKVGTAQAARLARSSTVRRQMKDRDRLDQLRELLARLERMPASADRDWMLAEVRARAVDVETGVATAPMRALPHGEPASEVAGEPAPRAARQRRSRRAQRPTLVHPPMPAPVRESRPEDVVDLLEQGGVICLDDSPAAATAASRAWSGGLRG
jgi:hypothetical protein